MREIPRPFNGRMNQWFKLIAPRIREITPLFQPFEKLILSRTAGTSESEKHAAQSARDIREKIQSGMSKEDEETYEMAKAFEAYIAYGIRGKLMDPTSSADSAKAIPGYFGLNFPNTSLCDAERDLHHGLDFVVEMNINGRKIYIAFDVTTSKLKLQKKLVEIRNRIENGSRSPLASHANPPGALRFVIGISSEQMNQALMAFGRTDNRIEPFEARALGACIREQFVVQLQKYAEHAEKHGRQELAGDYRAVLQKITSVPPFIPERKDSLGGDPLNQEILGGVKNLEKAKWEGK